MKGAEILKAMTHSVNHWKSWKRVFCHFIVELSKKTTTTKNLKTYPDHQDDNSQYFSDYVVICL